MKALILAEATRATETAVTGLLAELSNSRKAMEQEQQIDIESARSDLAEMQVFRARIAKQHNDLIEFISDVSAAATEAIRSAEKQITDAINSTFSALLDREDERGSTVASRLRHLEGTANETEPVQAGP